MSDPTFEIVGKLLFVTGSLDRATDPEFQQSLERLAAQVPPEERVVDMSNVHWLTPSGAKVLIQAGQDAIEKNGRVRVLASRSVVQTLNILGAKTWLTIESCLTPNEKPMAPLVKPAESAAKLPAVKAPGDQTQAPAAETARNSGLEPLANSQETLTGGATLLRILYANRRYNFGLSGGEQIMGVIKERCTAQWISLEVHGNRKLINLDLVTFCEPM